MDIVLVGILALGVLAVVNVLNMLKKKMDYMTKKLDHIMDHLGLEDNSIDEELQVFIDLGKAETAVKVLRERTGMELNDAKEYVNRLMDK